MCAQAVPGRVAGPASGGESRGGAAPQRGAGHVQHGQEGPRHHLYVDGVVCVQSSAVWWHGFGTMFIWMGLGSSPGPWLCAGVAEAFGIICMWRGYRIPSVVVWLVPSATSLCVRPFNIFMYTGFNLLNVPLRSYSAFCSCMVVLFNRSRGRVWLRPPCLRPPVYRSAALHTCHRCKRSPW